MKLTELRLLAIRAFKYSSSDAMSLSAFALELLVRHERMIVASGKDLRLSIGANS